MGRIREDGLEMTTQAVAPPISTRIREKETVAQRAAFRELGACRRGAKKGSYQSRTQEVASALRAVLNDPMVVAKIPAMSKPRTPAGSSCRI